MGWLFPKWRGDVGVVQIREQRVADQNFEVTEAQTVDNRIVSVQEYSQTNALASL